MGEIVAPGKGFIADTGNRVGNGDAVQAAARTERIVTDAGDSARDGGTLTTQEQCVALSLNKGIAIVTVTSSNGKVGSCIVRVK